MKVVNDKVITSEDKKQPDSLLLAECLSMIAPVSLENSSITLAFILFFGNETWPYLNQFLIF